MSPLLRAPTKPELLTITGSLSVSMLVLMNLQPQTSTSLHLETAMLFGAMMTF
jgi:hypothetical protein